MAEKHTENPVTTWAMANGIAVLKFTPAGNAGWPDRLYLCHGGVAAFIEYKADGKKPRKLQIYRLEHLRTLGFPTMWTTDYEKAVAFLRDVSTLRLSDKGNKVHDWASMCGLIPGSWTREDGYKPDGARYTKK